MQKMGGWHQNRNRHPGVRLDHSGSFRNAHRGRGGYGTGIHTAEGAIPKWLRLSYELGVLCDSVRLHCPPSWRQSLASGGDSRPMNRWNLGCRALLELAALGVMGTWGYENGTGVGQYVLMAGVPVTAGALWGIFAVQGDPSRSGQTVVPTPGVIRWDSNWRCAGLGTAPIRQRDDLRLDPHGFANMQALRALCVRRWFPSDCRTESAIDRFFAAAGIRPGPREDTTCGVAADRRCGRQWLFGTAIQAIRSPYAISSVDRTHIEPPLASTQLSELLHRAIPEGDSFGSRCHSVRFPFSPGV